MGVVQTVVQKVITVILVFAQADSSIFIACSINTMLSSDAAKLVVNSVFPLFVPAAFQVEDGFVLVSGVQGETPALVSLACLWLELGQVSILCTPSHAGQGLGLVKKSKKQEEHDLPSLQEHSE